MVAKQIDGIRVFSSEGGHVNFAPTSSLEWDLFQYLLKTLKRVSVERLCSGPGIYNIFAFLRDTKRERIKSAIWERTQLYPAPQVIAEAAINGECAMCEHTMEIFARILGAHAGNVLLTYLATGGIFIGGGIAPKVIKFLERSAVTASYLAKGRLSPIVEATPLVVIRDERAGLTGAARIAEALIGQNQRIYF
jgi:glucokinase